MENDGRKDCSGSSVERLICDMPGDKEIKKQDERQMRGNRIILHGSYTVEAAVVCASSARSWQLSHDCSCTVVAFNAARPAFSIVAPS